MNYTLYDKGKDKTSDSYFTTKTPFPSELEKLESTSYATSGAPIDLGNYIYRFTSNYDILRALDFGASSDSNTETIKYVRFFINVLQNVLLKNRINIKRSLQLPPLKIRWVEDQSALIEWIFKDFRIGFSIEPNIKDSGWYLVSNNNLQEMSASGELQLENLESLIINLLNFAIVNS
jgi:hypothetical protein